MLSDCGLVTRDSNFLCFNYPEPAAIDPQTIHTVFRRIPRFSGHTFEMYNVAQHSELVAELMQEHYPDRPELVLPALLHDVHEMYSGFGDVILPAKQFLRAYTPALDLLERAIDHAVAARFNFPVHLFYDPCVKEMDRLAVAIEARDVMVKPPDELMWYNDLPLISGKYAQERFIPTSHYPSFSQLRLFDCEFTPLIKTFENAEL